MGQAAYCTASLVLKYSYLDLVFMATLKEEGGVPITAQHVNQVEAEAKKLIDLSNTAGKASNMASFIVALHIIHCGTAQHNVLRFRERVRR